MKNSLFHMYRYLLAFQRLILFFFIAIFGGIVTISVVFYQNHQAYQHTNELVLHTHETIEQAGSIAAFSKDLQWESRTFILTGDTSALRRYHRVRNNLGIALSRLAKQSADNPPQQTRVKQLKAHIDSLVAFIDKTVASNATKNHSLGDYIKSKLSQDVFYTAINEQIENIITQENRLLDAREAASAKNVKKNYFIFIASGVLIFLILAAAYGMLYDNLQQRKKAEQQLAESEKGFRLLVTSIKDLAIYTTDIHGCILNWYTGASNIQGYTREEVIGKNVSIFYTAEAVRYGEPEQELQSAAQNGSYETQGWRVRKDGSVFWADVLTTAMYDESGQITGFTKVARDFSIHKKAEDEVRQMLEKEKELNEMKSNFVSMASHEFRTPLSTILTSIALIEQYRTTETQNKRDKHIERIKSSVSEMVYILEEFLSLEKIEENKVTPRYVSFDIQQLAEHVCGKFLSGHRDRPIHYFHTGGQMVSLDKNMVEHILTNLLSNAVKYSPDAAEITVRTNVTEQAVELEVKDCGIGISAADQKHLFERFFRASNTGNIKGTGLGLHIIKRYADLMKGTVYVQSEVGKGSQFTVIFSFM